MWGGSLASQSPAPGNSLVTAAFLPQFPFQDSNHDPTRWSSGLSHLQLAASHSSFGRVWTHCHRELWFVCLSDKHLHAQKENNREHYLVFQLGFTRSCASWQDNEVTVSNKYHHLDCQAISIALVQQTQGGSVFLQDKMIKRMPFWRETYLWLIILQLAKARTMICKLLLSFCLPKEHSFSRCKRNCCLESRNTQRVIMREESKLFY